MARGRETARTIRLTPEEQQRLQAWQRVTTLSAGRARRGRIILLVAEGRSITTITATLGISRRFVYTWVQRFQQAGLADQPGRGRVRAVRQPTLPAQPDGDVDVRHQVAC
jgi:Homeodomain-like domain